MTDESPDIPVRRLRADDYEAVRALWERSGLPVKLAGREAREAFVAQLEQFPATYLGAQDGGRLVGVVLGTHDHRKGWINRLAVDPGYQRQRLGSLLLQTCEEALCAQGIEIIAALIEGGNEVSRGIFEHCGYTEFAPVHYYRKLFRPDI